MFEQSFKNIDNELHKDAGCSTEMDYIEQTSWLLFLKYMEDLENNRALEAELNGRQYNPIINKKYTWSSWAYPKNADGKLDYDQAMTGDDLILFVRDELFPYLAKFKELADTPDTLEYKIGIIFSEIRNKINDGYIMRNVIGYMQDMRFQTSKEKHELSELYENKIQNMGNSGRNGGEYYTPRPLIRAIIKAVKPQLGNRIYDGACGSAGFLVEAFNYLKESKSLTVDKMEFLQKKTLYGKEFKPLPYIIAIMNMILHGVEAPNIIRKDTLSENIMSIQSKDQYDIVLANPPFGAATSKTDIQNFPIKTSKSEEELRRIWLDPLTRKILLKRFAEQGYNRDVFKYVQNVLNAEDKDVFDVLNYLAEYCQNMKTRLERANQCKVYVMDNYASRQCAFIDFVLQQYVKEGVFELDDERIGELVTLKYGSAIDAVQELGSGIRNMFCEFQQYLYQKTA